MLTPIEIERKVLKTGIGYEKKDVDVFLKEIYDDYERLYKENVELTDKINTLSEGIQYYKSIEKTLQKALVLAQRTADDTKEAAGKQALAIEKEARAKAELIVADAHRDLELLHTKTVNLLQQYDLYKAEFKKLAAAQLELIESDSFQIKVANLDTFLSTPDDAKPVKESKAAVSLEDENYEPDETDDEDEEELPVIDDTVFDEEDEDPEIEEEDEEEK